MRWDERGGSNKPRDASAEAESAPRKPSTNQRRRGGRSVAEVQRNRLVAAKLDHHHEQRNGVDGDVKRKQHGPSLHLDTSAVGHPDQLQWPTLRSASTRIDVTTGGTRGPPDP